MKKDRYYNIVTFMAQAENNPKLSWEECKFLARKWFIKAGFKGVNYRLLKKSWREFSKASGVKVFI